MFKLKMAHTLIDMYGDPILSDLQMFDPSKSQAQRCEDVLDEIIHDMHSRTVCQLKESDWFGE